MKRKDNTNKNVSVKTGSLTSHRLKPYGFYAPLYKKYKIKGDLFVRAMYKFAQGTEDEAIDYYVINHEKSNGCVYNGKTNEWAKILNKK